jgi:predicted ATPase
VRELPTGTVTFLFTDVEGSTRLLHELGAERYAVALAEHRQVIRRACAAHGGIEVDAQGDSLFVAFPTAVGAVAAAAEMTENLAAGPIRVRIGLHTGTPLVTDGAYVGRDVHLAARIAAAGHGGQVLVSGTTAALEPGIELRDLGEHRLKNFDDPVTIYQLGNDVFPPLAASSTTNLPRPAGAFVGRQRELEDVLARVEDGARLVTLTGPGGCGKSRLAIEAAAALVPAYAGVYWVGLAPLRAPERVLGAIGLALGARGDVAEHVGVRKLLVVVDNFEHVVAAAPGVSTLVSACPNLTVVVTSRERLGIAGEVELQVPPLAAQDAVALFCERAQVEPSAEIAELCRRLDALPLAVELAAARTKALSPRQILERLSQRLDLLAGGRDADPRQQTLRATMDWSHQLLSEPEQRLFARLSVFSGGFDLDAAVAVAGADLDTVQSLVEKSLLRFSNERYAMLETVREFAAERLAPEEAGMLRRRHRAWVVALAEASAPKLHTAEEAAVSAQLAPEYANVRAAVAHALAEREPDDVGRIVGALYPFLISHGDLVEVRAWGEAALEAGDRLSEAGRAEALIGTSEIARFGGDLDRARELKEELAGVQVELHRPNWRAATLADLCELALDQGYVADARAYAEQSAAAGAGARAELCFAELALRTGDLAAAESHGLAALGGFDEGAFNHATTLELLGEAARRAGDVERARERFADALRAFSSLNDGGGIADSLDGLARLAADGGDATRAGSLLGAAETLRETRGRRPIRLDLPPPDVPAAARDEGRAMALEDALAYALGTHSS